jgi:hypothetical protein
VAVRIRRWPSWDRRPARVRWLSSRFQRNAPSPIPWNQPSRVHRQSSPKIHADRDTLHGRAQAFTRDEGKNCPSKVGAKLSVGTALKAEGLEHPGNGGPGSAEGRMVANERGRGRRSRRTRRCRRAAGDASARRRGAARDQQRVRQGDTSRACASDGPAIRVRPSLTTAQSSSRIPRSVASRASRAWSVGETLRRSCPSPSRPCLVGVP